MGGFSLLLVTPPSSTLLPPHRSSVLVAPSSSSPLPRRSFLLAVPSPSSLLLSTKTLRWVLIRQYDVDSAHLEEDGEPEQEHCSECSVLETFNSLRLLCIHVEF